MLKNHIYAAIDLNNAENKIMPIFISKIPKHSGIFKKYRHYKLV